MNDFFIQPFLTLSHIDVEGVCGGKNCLVRSGCSRIKHDVDEKKTSLCVQV